MPSGRARDEGAWEAGALSGRSLPRLIAAVHGHAACRLAFAERGRAGHRGGVGAASCLNTCKALSPRNRPRRRGPGGSRTCADLSVADLGWVAADGGLGGCIKCRASRVSRWLPHARTPCRGLRPVPRPGAGAAGCAAVRATILVLA